MTWHTYRQRVVFARGLCHCGSHRRVFTRTLIVITVVGEAICLSYSGVAHDWVGAYTIGAAWIKDRIMRRFE